MTLSFSRDELALYKPSELASRLGLIADGQGVRLALCVAGNACELFWPRFDMGDARRAHVPAPWTRRFVFDDVQSLDAYVPGREEAENAASLADAEPVAGASVGAVLWNDVDQLSANGEDALSAEQAAELADLLDLVDELDEEPHRQHGTTASMPSLAEIEALLANVTVE